MIKTNKYPKKMKSKLLILCSLILMISTSVYAQTTTSKITGTITEKTGEALFGANIIALHTPTGTLSGTTAQINGRYTLSNLRIGGPYAITISYVGFETQKIANVFLTLGKTTNIDAVLSDDKNMLDEIVISSGKNTVFNNGRTGAQTSIRSKDLRTLPTISRSASDFTRLDPAASGGSFGGRNDQYNNFTLDGSIFNNPFGLDAATPGGQTGSQPVSLDAIEQISVSTAPYDVTLSGFTGASVNAVTKSGTNKVSGTVYGFFRNQDFTGGKIKGENIFVPQLRQSQSGVSVGAPLIKDKLFIFVNFEEDKRTDLGQSWLPNTGSNRINESRVLRADLAEVQSALAGIGYNTGAYEGFTHDSNSSKGLFKLDWNINKDNRVSFVYNFLNASRDLPAHPTALGFRGPSSQMLQFENTGYQINNNLKSFLVELNSTLDENITNKLQVGYTHFDDFRNPKSAPMPAFRIQDGRGGNYIIAGHEPFSIHNKLDQKVFQVTNNLNITKGDHNYTVGFSFEKFEFDNSFNLGVYGLGDSRGYVGAFGGDFADMDGFRAGISSGLLADAFAAAQNTFNNKNANNSWALAETNVGQLAFYVQDDWNINDNFKFSYGVRFDKPLFFDSAQKAQDVIDGTPDYFPGIPYINPNSGQVQQLSNTQMPSSDWLVSPRLGFNYDVKGDSSIQLRGGTGLFTGRFPFVWLGNQIGNPNFWFQQNVDPDYKFPQVWRTSFGADVKLKDGTILTTDISYTKDINGAHVQNWGLTPPTGTLQGVDSRAVYTDNDHVVGAYGSQANAYVFTNSDKGRTLNASLKAQKTFDNGLYLMAAYNFLDSKDVNSIEAEITGDAFAFNPVLSNANSATLAHSKYGDRHRFIAVAAKSWNYGANNEWTTTLSSFYELAKGGRFNYTYAGDINNDGSNLNDLIYIPTTSEIGQMDFSTATDADNLENFIKQDDYLKGRRGQYAERYGALTPWRGKMDVKFIQNLKIKDNNSLEFSIDILNFGNLLNSDWGLVQQPNAVQPIGVSVDAGGSPTYSFNSNLKETFVYNSTLISRWQMQFGLRYSF
jgi:hypothetical protein